MVQITLGAVQFWPPERMQWLQQANHQRVELMDAGEITQLCPPRQREIAFSGLLPAESTPFSGMTPPEEAAAALKQMLSDSKPVRFSLSGVEAPVEMEVTVESVQLWETAGEGLSYALQLREYTSAEAVVSGGSVREEQTTDARTYTVQAGDTLWSIAKQLLGDGSRYGEIAAASGIGNPNLIYPGQVVVIPASGS